MEIDKGEIKADLQYIQDQADGMGFVGTNENDLWRREIIADYIVEKLSIFNVNKSLVCSINGCKNIRDKDKFLCEEHFD